MRFGVREGSLALHAFQTSTPCRRSSRCSGLAISCTDVETLVSLSRLLQGIEGMEDGHRVRLMRVVIHSCDARQRPSWAH